MAQPRQVQKTIQAGRQPTPEEIMEKLKKATTGTSSRTVRFAIQQLENLIDAGTNALPAIREFLALNQDIAYSFAGGKGSKLGADFVVPPSLRLGLFDVVKHIGGSDAVKLLADVLKTTGSALEVAYLANELQEVAPNQYRDLALSVAQNLLTQSTTANLDKNQRDNLYAVLTSYKDPSLLAQAQTQLVQTNGQIDRSALKYLQNSLGDQTVPIAAAAYNTSGLNPADKEELAKIGLYYAGVNPQANAFLATAVNDQSLPLDVRSGLVKDLGQDGFNEKNPGAADLPIIQARLGLIDASTAAGIDPTLQAAFLEAQKDLLKAQAKIPPNPPR
jgi:hypothetical protein